jgi:hypothetical protein
MRRIVVAGLAIGAVGAGVSAAPAQAATVWMLAEVRSANMLSVQFNAASGEDNDVTMERSEPGAVRVVDRGATLTSGDPEPVGECDARMGCWVPCRIVTDHEARCVLADGYTSTESVGFRPAEVRLADGQDRFTTLPGIGQSAEVEDDDGGDVIKLGAGGSAGAGPGDVVEFGNPLAGGSAIGGGGIIRARDGAAQSIYCFTSGYGRIEMDPLDKAFYYCAGLGPLGTVP